MPGKEINGKTLSGEFVLGDLEFDLLRQFIHGHTGIALGPHKREMLKARLQRRLRALGMTAFMDYYQLLSERDAGGEELVRCVNAVTTNVTEFFREPHHFQFLAENWLPQRRSQAAQTGDRHIRIWSAGCSTGEEPYTIALMLREGLGPALAGWDVRILASDIDTDALSRAAAGVYPLERVASLPQPLLARGFLRGTGANVGQVRVRPELQDLVAFRRINLIDESWPVHTRFDAIFCRNVLIYFNRPTQQAILRRLVSFLKDDGLLFLGHSESLNGLFAGMKHWQNTIYQRIGSVTAVSPHAAVPESINKPWNPSEDSAHAGDHHDR